MSCYKSCLWIVYELFKSCLQVVDELLMSSWWVYLPSGVKARLRQGRACQWSRLITGEFVLKKLCLGSKYGTSHTNCSIQISPFKKRLTSTSCIKKTSKVMEHSLKPLGPFYDNRFGLNVFVLTVLYCTSRSRI